MQRGNFFHSRLLSTCRLCKFFTKGLITYLHWWLIITKTFIIYAFAIVGQLICVRFLEFLEVHMQSGPYVNGFCPVLGKHFSSVNAEYNSR